MNQQGAQRGPASGQRPAYTRAGETAEVEGRGVGSLPVGSPPPGCVLGKPLPFPKPLLPHQGSSDTDSVRLRKEGRGKFQWEHSALRQEQLGRDRPPAAAEGSDGRGQGVGSLPPRLCSPLPETLLAHSAPSPVQTHSAQHTPEVALPMLPSFPVTQAHKPLLALVLLSPSRSRWQTLLLSVSWPRSRLFLLPTVLSYQVVLPKVQIENARKPPMGPSAHWLKYRLTSQTCKAVCSTHPPAFPASSLTAPLYKLCTPSTPSPFLPTSLPLLCSYSLLEPPFPSCQMTSHHPCPCYCFLGNLS